VRFGGLSRSVAAVWLVLLMALMAGCASVNPGRGGSASNIDPWENWNRKVFAFNERLDANVLKPVAMTYNKVVPSMVRTGVSNFFGTFADAWSGVNNLLQGKIELGFRDMFRAGINASFGVFGLLDVATDLGLERQGEDFGQTLGRWGVGTGPYVVWPLLGPSTLRESFALPLDRWLTSPASLSGDLWVQANVSAVQLVNARAGLLGASRLIDDIALDKYTFLRDAYLQRRRSQVYDGEEPPEEPDPADMDLAPAASASAPRAAPPAAAASAAALAPASGSASAPAK
jgi:phospholipid-binding lipoprotein MlaA